MIDSAQSGVIFTADPSASDRSVVVIEAAFGLGEVVVGGQIEVDTYSLLKAGPRIQQIRVGHKVYKIVRTDDGQERRVDLSADDATRRVLSDAEIETLATLAIRVEEHYKAPQDVAWAEQKGVFYLVQTRPITTLVTSASGAVLVSGLAASPGIASGRVRVLRSPTDGPSDSTTCGPRCTRSPRCRGSACRRCMPLHARSREMPRVQADLSSWRQSPPRRWPTVSLTLCNGRPRRADLATGQCSRFPLPSRPGANGRARQHRAVKRTPYERFELPTPRRSNRRGSVILVNERTMHDGDSADGT